MRISSAKIVLSAALLAITTVAGGALFAGSALAAPGDNPVVAKGTLEDYSFSKNYDSFDPTDSLNLKQVASGHGHVPAVLAKLPNALTINAASAQTTITIPLGWYALDQGKQTVIYSPDETTRFMLHFIDVAPYRNFDDFKSNVMPALQNKVNQPTAIFHQFAMPDGGTAIEISDVTTKTGQKNGMVTVYTADPKNMESHTVMSVSLTSPQADLLKYEGLLGLMLQNRQITWR